MIFDCCLDIVPTYLSWFFIFYVVGNNDVFMGFFTMACFCHPSFSSLMEADSPSGQDVETLSRLRWADLADMVVPSYEE